MLKHLLFSIAVLICTYPATAAVILQYHHVANGTPASTSVSPQQFSEQMQYLSDNDFQVIPLPMMINKLKSGEQMPPRTVAITFDDGYQDIADNAAPILQRFGFAYTIFINIEPIVQNYPNMMSWETLAQLSKNGATIANHSYSHKHLVHDLSPGWLDKVLEDIETTETIISEKLGHNYKIFAYPYGEYNLALTNALKARGYSAVGQHSGAVGGTESLQALPRFPVAGSYANMETLKVKMHALPMPVTKLDGFEPQLLSYGVRPKLTLKIDHNDINNNQIMCFVSGQGAKAPQWTNETTFVIQANRPLPPGRSRYNCTAPSLTEGAYYWFSQSWMAPKADGSYVKD